MEGGLVRGMWRRACVGKIVGVHAGDARWEAFGEGGDGGDGGKGGCLCVGVSVREAREEDSDVSCGGGEDIARRYVCACGWA